MRGGCYALTRRTNMRKAFLAPWHEDVSQALLYSLGSAQEATGVTLHCFTPNLTHYHLSHSDDNARRPEFVRLFNGDVSRALNTLLARKRYDAPGQIWDNQPTHCMRLLDAEAQAAHLIYEALQCVAAGLVRKPGDMTGFVFEFDMWARDAIRVRRTDFFFDPRTRPEWVNVRFRPPAKLRAAFGGDLKRLIHYMNRLMREAIRELNRARKWPVMGAQRVKRIHPYSEPRTRRETGGLVKPTYKQGARGLEGREVHIVARTQTTEFRRSSREAFASLREGKPTTFPYGTWQWRQLLGVDVHNPDPSNLITGPEPTVDEVIASFEDEPRRASDEKVATLLTEVRETYRDEASEVVEANALELVGDTPRVTVVAKPEPGARPPAVTKHRFDKNEPSEAARIVVKRDARRGRRRKSDDISGGDDVATDAKQRRGDSDPPE